MKSSNEISGVQPKLAPVLGNFYPLPILWDDASAPKEVEGAALFKSEASARWFVKKHRAELVKAEAVAIWTGRFIVHPGRVQQFAKEVSFRAMAGYVKAGV